MSLQNAFQKFNQTQKAFGPWGLVRQNGFQYFQKHGLPTKLDEEWKYTSLKNLPETLLEPQDFHTVVIPQDLKKNLAAYISADFWHLVFINGALVMDLSDLKALKKIKVVGLEEVEQTSVFRSIRKVRKTLGKVRQDAMEALN